MPVLDDVAAEQQHALRLAAANLRREFDGTFGQETIEQFLAASYEDFAADAKVGAFCRSSPSASRANDSRRWPGWWSPWAAAMPAPLFPGKRDEDWELDEPAGQDLEAVRPIRDEIGRQVRQLLTSLDVPVS